MAKIKTGKRSRPIVIFEFAVYSEAAKEITNTYLKSGPKKKVEYNENKATHSVAVGIISEIGLGGIEKIDTPDNKSGITTFRIGAPGLFSDPFESLNIVGAKTGSIESGMPYQSLIIKELKGQKMDFGIYEGKAYKDGQVLEGKGHSLEFLLK